MPTFLPGLCGTVRAAFAAGFRYLCAVREDVRSVRDNVREVGHGVLQDLRGNVSQVRRELQKRPQLALAANGLSENRRGLSDFVGAAEQNGSVPLAPRIAL